MLYDIILKNRSYRSFDSSQPVSQKALKYLVDCARQAASTANLQALKYKIVHGSEMCKIVLKYTSWAGYIQNEQIPPKGHEPTGYIVICHDKEISDNPIPFYKDCGIAAQTILLAATEMDFGGCMIGSFKEAELKKELSLADNFSILLVVALGTPDETVELTDISTDIKYYRKNGVHYVPKRALKDVLIK